MILSGLQSFPQTIIRKFSQTDGLVSYNVHSIVTDKSGFVWLATQDGVSRYNGNDFLNYRKDSNKKKFSLDFVDCRKLFIDTVLQKTWVLGSKGGIDVIDIVTGNVTERYIRPVESADEWYVTFEKIANKFWIGTTKGLLVFDIATGKFGKVSLPQCDGNEVSRINVIRQDTYGNIWIFIKGKGCCILRPDATVIRFLDFAELGEAMPSLDFLSSCITGHRVWLGTETGLVVFDFDVNYRIRLFSLPSLVKTALLNNPVSHISVLDTSVYLCGKAFISLSKNGNNIRMLSRECTDDWLGEILDISPMAGMVVALGCNAGLAFFDLSDKAIHAVHGTESYFNGNLKHLYAIAPLSDGSVLAATQTGLFRHFLNATMAPLGRQEMYQNISIIGPDEFLVSNKRGISVYKNNKLQDISTVSPKLAKYSNWKINSCARLADGGLVFGTENYRGILYWDSKNDTVYNYDSHSPGIQLSSDNVNSVYLDSFSRVWVLSDNSISVVDLTRKAVKNLAFKPGGTAEYLGLFFDMCQVGSQYWIATYGVGIVKLNERFDLTGIINYSAGLCDNSVYKIFKDSNYVFVSSNNGVSRIDTRNERCKNLSAPESGLHGNSFEEACGSLYNGKIYFGGLDGYSVLDPRRIAYNITAPRTYFQKIEIVTPKGMVETLDSEVRSIEVPPGFQSVKVSFAGINYADPDHVSYRYRIVETNQEWSVPGSQNFVDFIGTAPGTYTLEVKAANEDKVESAPISMTLRFLPKWYQTWWFKVVVLLAISGLLYLLYAFRIRQVEKLYAVRQKISQDLHDDIGSTLSTIQMYSDIAQLHQPGENRFVGEIKTNTRDVLDKLDDIVWATNPKNDQVTNLAHRIDGFARPLLHAKGILFELEMNQELVVQKIAEASRQNLFLICKEAINNAAKYAACKHIWVRLQKKKKYISCTIQDDGNGFDPNLPTERNGLLNMRQRAASLKGRFKIDSDTGKGTIVTVEIPL